MKPTPLIKLQGRVAHEEALIPVVLVCGEGIVADTQHVSSIERSVVHEGDPSGRVGVAQAQSRICPFVRGVDQTPRRLSEEANAAYHAAGTGRPRGGLNPCSHGLWRRHLS